MLALGVPNHLLRIPLLHTPRRTLLHRIHWVVLLAAHLVDVVVAERIDNVCVEDRVVVVVVMLLLLLLVVRCLECPEVGGLGRGLTVILHELAVYEFLLI